MLSRASCRVPKGDTSLSFESLETAHVRNLK